MINIINNNRWGVWEWKETRNLTIEMPSIERDAIQQLPPMLVLKSNHNIIYWFLPWFSCFNLIIKIINTKSYQYHTQHIMNLKDKKKQSIKHTSWQRSKASRAPTAASSWLSLTSKLITSTIFMRTWSRLWRSAIV